MVWAQTRGTPDRTDALIWASVPRTSTSSRSTYGAQRVGTSVRIWAAERQRWACSPAAWIVLATSGELVLTYTDPVSPRRRSIVAITATDAGFFASTVSTIRPPYRASTVSRVGAGSTVGAGLSHEPVSSVTVRQSAPVKRLTGPVEEVVRSTVASCISTTVPSRSSWVSRSSTCTAPEASIRSMPDMLFSRTSRPPPRWASYTTEGRAEMVAGGAGRAPLARAAGGLSAPVTATTTAVSVAARTVAFVR